MALLSAFFVAPNESKNGRRSQVLAEDYQPGDLGYGPWTPHLKYLQDLQVGHLKKKCRQAVGAAKSAGSWS